MGEEKKKEWKPPKNPPSIYVGETARSLYERSKEHWRGYKTKSEDSHILKHHLIHHGGEGEPSFLMKPIRYFKTALSRQIAEALRIQERGEDIVLNSKAEYNHSKIGRLMLGEEEPGSASQGVQDQEGREEQARESQES